MSRRISSLCLLVAAALLLTSCLGNDEEEITLYDDIAITAFQITAAEAEMHTTSSTGEDSVYVETNTDVASYPFSIDQLKGEIFNVDSLPANIDASRMLCSWSTKNNGLVFMLNEARDSMRYLSTTDTVDFSKPCTVVVYSSDGVVSREYTVKVNVRQVEPGAFGWQRMTDSPELAALQAMRAVMLGGRVLVAGDEGGRTAIFSTADGSAWTRSSAVLGQDAYNNVVSRNDTLFVLDGGAVKYSLDGETFVTVAQTPSLARLVGGSTTEMYALATDGTLMASDDGGQTWAADDVDDDASLLPAQDMSYICAPYESTDSTDYVVLAGSRDLTAYPDDGNAMVWRKIVEYSEDSRSGKWINIPAGNGNIYPLPRLEGLTMVAYGGSVLAFGGHGIGACDDEAFSQIYESRDGGITWKQNDSYVFPDGFDSSDTSFSAVADGSGYLWIVCGGTGQVWRGQLADDE